MIAYLKTCEKVEVQLGHNVNDFSKQANGRWKIDIENRSTEEVFEVFADYVFIGAGGGTIQLLEKSKVEESQGYGGFPISGQFLRCTNTDVIRRHKAKVYGKAAVGSPPMSVPHLDTRMIDGHQSLFFGPYAGFSTKFLKNGSYLDLPLSIEMHNIWPILAAGIRNVDLTKYLIQQVTQSAEDRFRELLVYYPHARPDDWELTTAGQRVQIIKKDQEEGGVLKFGTEIVCTADRSMAALLGASPGASTSVSIMLEVIGQMFPDEIKSKEWQQIIKSMIPTYATSLAENGPLCFTTRERTAEILNLNTS
jgi:malate dehydrogenase (quinone)